MGNISFSSITRTNAESGTSIDDKKSSSKSQVYVIPRGKLPLLHVVKDNSCQSDENQSLSKSGNKLCNLVSLLLMVVGIAYFGMCYMIICSKYVQTYLVYAHHDKVSRNLTNLLEIGLPQGKNIQIQTEDGLILRGWHLMYPGYELLQANVLNETDRNSYFDRSLANSDRIIVYFHGNSQTRGQHFRVEKVKQLSTFFNAHVITFDYRGFADSDGFPSEEGILLDSTAVINYIDEKVRLYRYAGSTDIECPHRCSNFRGLLTVNSIDSDKNCSCQIKRPYLYLYGHSLGAAISTDVAVKIRNLSLECEIGGLILDAPFAKLSEAIKVHPNTKPFRIFPLVFDAM